MNSRTTEDFRRDFAKLPAAIQKQARAAYRQFLADPFHPGLKFKKLPPFENHWSVRITGDYRAIGRREDDLVVWFFIGSHADYDQMIARM